MSVQLAFCFPLGTPQSEITQFPSLDVRIGDNLMLDLILDPLFRLTLVRRMGELLRTVICHHGIVVA
jgi:hypothetical protein